MALDALTVSFLYHAPLDLTDAFVQTAVSSSPQHSSVAAETDRGITWQTGSANTLLGVPGIADGGDPHPLPPATDGAAGTGPNPFAESARQACQNDTITNGSSVSPAKTEVPDLAVPHIEEGIGEQSFAAGVDLAVPHIEDGIGEQSFAAGVELAVPHIEDGIVEQSFAAGVDLAVPHSEDSIGEQSFATGVDLAVPHIEDGIGEQSFAAGVDQQHNSVLLEDASSVKITKVWLNWHMRKSRACLAGVHID